MPYSEPRYPVPHYCPFCHNPYLSMREIRIIRSIMLGRSNRQIGRELGYTEKTVKNYVGFLMKRLDVPNRTALAVWATKKGL